MPMREQYAQAWASAEADAYVGALKKRYKATPPDCPAGVLDAAVAEAKALVRQRHNVDPELPGFVGLVRIYAQQIIKQRKGA